MKAPSNELTRWPTDQLERALAVLQTRRALEGLIREPGTRDAYRKLLLGEPEVWARLQRALLAGPTEEELRQSQSSLDAEVARLDEELARLPSEEREEVEAELLTCYGHMPANMPPRNHDRPRYRRPRQAMHPDLSRPTEEEWRLWLKRIVVQLVLAPVPRHARKKLVQKIAADEADMRGRWVSDREAWRMLARRIRDSVVSTEMLGARESWGDPLVLGSRALEDAKATRPAESFADEHGRELLKEARKHVREEASRRGEKLPPDTLERRARAEAGHRAATLQREAAATTSGTGATLREPASLSAPVVGALERGRIVVEATIRDPAKRIQAIRMLDTLAARLKPKDFEVWVMREVEGLRGIDVVEATGQPDGTVKWRLSTAREVLEAIRKEGGVLLP